jgi:hypothetical protein
MIFPPAEAPRRFNLHPSNFEFDSNFEFRPSYFPYGPFFLTSARRNAI